MQRRDRPRCGGNILDSQRPEACSDPRRGETVHSVEETSQSPRYLKPAHVHAEESIVCRCVCGDLQSRPTWFTGGLRGLFRSSCEPSADTRDSMGQGALWSIWLNRIIIVIRAKNMQVPCFCKEHCVDERKGCVGLL